MVAGNWTNSDNLYLKYGTSKTVAEAAGDYPTIGESRIMEVRVDLSTLATATASILSDNVLFGPGANNSNSWIIEKVELSVDTAATSSGSGTFKMGFIQNDRATVPSNYDHALINAETTANMATVGDRLVYVGADSIPAGSTHGGTLIGSAPASATGPYYLTAQAATAVFQTGVVRVRIFYHGIGTITQ